MTAQARPPEVRRRPRDRRQQILAAAAERFWSVGYHRVSMAEIAADVGIGASALYRHFGGKQELLLAALDQHLGALEAIAADPERDLLDECAAYVLEHRDFGVLWEREAGHLPEGTRRALRHRLRALAVRTRELTVDDEHADTRAWAALSVLDSPSHRSTRLDPERFRALLTAAARAVATAPFAVPRGTAGRSGPGIAPASRREVLLGVAVTLFAERGYAAVGLGDIGAAAGIAGPSVYNHFGSKIEVLSAALTRGNEALWLGLHRALSAASDPADGLARLVADYTAFAAADPELVSILISEIIHLGPEQRAPFVRAQRAYVTEWATLLARVRPDRDADEVGVLVRAALTLVNSLSRIHHLRGEPGHTERTTALALAVLHA
ncbi:MAG: TetR family transcriptional regulator [Actinomycetota bacterium]|nr:TetR family transcriptional regulator [Actinomycetota bacterium]